MTEYEYGKLDKRGNIGDEGEIYYMLIRVNYIQFISHKFIDLSPFYCVLYISMDSIDICVCVNM